MSGGASGLLDALARAAHDPFVIALVAVLLAFAALAATLLVLLRRQRGTDGREVVRLLEELRSGKTHVRAEVDPRSPFAPVADSANRLARDLAVTLSRAETESEGFHALEEAARGYAVVTTDVDGDIRAASAGVGALFGWDEDAVHGRNASLLFDESSFKDLLPKLARKSLRERGIETRARMARRDGTRFEARLNVRMLRGRGDEPHGFLLVVQDVTEQVRVEEGLRAAEARARGMLDAVPTSVLLIEEGRIVASNAAASALFALAPGTEHGSFADRIATEDVLLVRDLLGRLEGAAEGEVEAADVRLRERGREPRREVRLVATAYRGDGRPAVLLAAADETRTRRLLRALHASEARLQAVLDASEDAVALLADDGGEARLRIANRAFLALTGIGRDAVAGASEGELLRALRGRGESGAATAACLAAASGGPAHDLVPWDGSEDRWIELKAAPFVSPDGRTRGRLLVARDVTLARRHERGLSADAERLRRKHEALEASYQRLRGMHDELEARRAEADRLAKELRALDTMKSDLLANVSHELQTPLVSIRGYTEMILKGRLGAVNDEQKKGLTLSLKNIDRLIAMIDNLLAFARMDRDAGAMKLSSFPLASVVDEALALLRDRIEAKRLRVSRRLEDESAELRADRDKILQVFLNLLSNAIKFNRDGGTVEVEAHRGKPGFALVQVRDTGVGIAKEDLERIFDRFYRIPEAAGAREGTGIGLAIVRNILRLHGCVIQASSEVGRGTTFAFTLPLAGSRGAEGERNPGPRPEPPAPRDEGGETPRERGGGDPPPPSAKAAGGAPRLRIIRRR